MAPLVLMKSGMVVGTLRIQVPLNRRAEVIQILRSIQGPVSVEPGCVGCHIYEEEDPEPAVVLVERWESEAALEEHIRSDTYRWVLGAIELSGKPPEVRFDSVSSTRGMELIERLRDLGATDLAQLSGSPVEADRSQQSPRAARDRRK